MLREDILEKFQAAWDDSHFGEEGKQQEQGGMLFGRKAGSGTSSENVDIKDERYQRIEGEWAHMLQFWQKFSRDTLANMSSDFELRYIYHSHPFKDGLKVLFRRLGYLKYKQGQAKRVSDGDYRLLKETNRTNPGVFGVLLTNEGIRVYNEDGVICDIKVIWKPRSSQGSGVLPQH